MFFFGLDKSTVRGIQLPRTVSPRMCSRRWGGHASLSEKLLQRTQQTKTASLAAGFVGARREAPSRRPPTRGVVKLEEDKDDDEDDDKDGKTGLLLESALQKSWLSTARE